MRGIWIFFLLFSTMFCYSQNRCHLATYRAQQAEENPNFSFEQAAKERAFQLAVVDFPRNGTLTIPVVFHIIDTSGAYFPSDEQVFSQIAVLNEDFGLQNENRNTIPIEAENLAVDMGLRFCLASVDPMGNPTSGIIRKVTTIPNIGSDIADDKKSIFYDQLSGSTLWDPNRYLNIYVTSMSSQSLGFANLPGDAIPEEDGVIIKATAFGRQTLNPIGTPFDLGRTCTHEVGHYFNLRHLWGDNGCSDDDGVLDTPPQDGPHQGCPIYPSTSCESPDFFFNYMDWSDDSCMSMFTHGQRERLWKSIAMYRPTLLRDLGCPEVVPNQALLVFPNPASSIVYFQFRAQAAPIEFHFFDSIGRKQGEVTFDNLGARWVDVYHWAAGVYYFRSTDNVYQGSFVVLN